MKEPSNNKSAVVYVLISEANLTVDCATTDDELAFEVYSQGGYIMKIFFRDELITEIKN